MQDSTTRLDSVRALCQELFEGTVNVVDVREIVAALLILFAYDEMDLRQSPKIEPPKRVRLSDFLTSLLGDSFAKTLAACANTKPTMQDVFDDGLVFFNHFVRLTEDPTSTTLHDAYQRGAALFAPYNFPGCNLIIPIFIPSANQYTFIIIQVKNRPNNLVTHSLQNAAADNLLAASDILNSASISLLPHIAMMMSFRCKDQQDDIGGTLSLCSHR
jgi:hypothetical protein